MYPGPPFKMSLLLELALKLREDNSLEDRHGACSLISSLPDEYSLAKVLSSTSIMPSLLEAINPSKSLALSAEAASTLVSLLIKADSTISMKLFIAHNFISPFKDVLERINDFSASASSSTTTSPSLLLSSLYTSVIILLKHLLMEDEKFNVDIVSFSMNALSKLKGEDQVSVLQLLLFKKEMVEIPYESSKITVSHRCLLCHLLSPTNVGVDLLEILDSVKEENMIIDVLDLLFDPSTMTMDIDAERVSNRLIILILSNLYSPSLLQRMYEILLKLIIDGVVVELEEMKKIWAFSFSLIPSVKDDFDFLGIIGDFLKLIIMIDDVDCIEVDNIVEVMMVIDGLCSSVTRDLDVISSLVMSLIHSGLLASTDRHDWSLKMASLLFNPQTTSINALIAATEIIEGLRDCNVVGGGTLFNYDLDCLSKFEDEFPEEVEYIRSVLVNAK